VTHQGYPSYFPVLLGTWKVLGAVALLVPRRPLLKEWAYAGAFFTYTGADRLPPDHRLRPRRGGLLAVLTALAALAGRPAAHLLLVQPAEPQACSLFGEPPTTAAALTQAAGPKRSPSPIATQPSRHRAGLSPRTIAPRS